MSSPKAKHKHIYSKHLRQIGKDPERYEIVGVCKMCGRVRDMPFKAHVIKRPDGTWKWMTTLEDFTGVYGNLPRIELL